MKQMRGYIFRLYPNKKQQELIEKMVGCYRFIYNYFLGINHKYINAYQCIKLLPSLCNEYEWLKEVDSCSLRCSIFNLEDAFKRYHNKQAEIPKFKSKNKSRQSYRTNNVTGTYKGHNYNSIAVDMERKVIKLPKLKEVKIRGYRNQKKIRGRIINATVYKEAGKYYVSICVEEEITLPKLIPTKIVGIDLGIKDLAITSDGIKYNSQKIINKYEKKIKGLNKWLARCTKGSKNRKKVIKKIQKVYQKLKNARKYLLHTISNEIIKDNDIIVTEKLKIKDMVQDKHLSKQILDSSWYELIRQLKYKSKWKNKKFYQVDTYYPSSQICSHCDYQNKKVKDLSIREWTCPKCDNKNDRDINASINIMYEGIKKYMDELQVS